MNSPGKPAFDIPAELLEDLLGLEFTYTRIYCGDVGSISLEYMKEDQTLWFRRFQVVGRLDLSSGSLLNDLKS